MPSAKSSLTIRWCNEKKTKGEEINEPTLRGRITKLPPEEALPLKGQKKKKEW